MPLILSQKYIIDKDDGLFKIDRGIFSNSSRNDVNALHRHRKEINRF